MTFFGETIIGFFTPTKQPLNHKQKSTFDSLIGFPSSALPDLTAISGDICFDFYCRINYSNGDFTVFSFAVKTIASVIPPDFETS